MNRELSAGSRDVANAREEVKETASSSTLLDLDSSFNIY
jgi:hypothetical protein